MSSSDPDPRRGGLNRYGPFTGGSAMQLDYTLASPSAVNYRSISQLRIVKTLTATEQMLQRRRDDISSLKFDGKLNLKETSSTTELSKTLFETELSRWIKLIGLESFFYVRNEDQTEMIFLPLSSHKITLELVISEYQSRLTEPDVVYRTITSPDGTKIDEETDASVEARFRCFDEYELSDIQLSRQVVDSLITTTLRTQVTTRYRHLPDFETFPGSVYLMMIYEVVNASTSLDIANAKTDFKDLLLSEYPGENISTFVDEALRLIHILECGYCLPYQLGSQLLEKVEETGSTYFNMQVQLMLHEARTMENTVGPISDPKSLELHSSYSTHGPVGLCGALQTLYTGLLRSGSWPALTEAIPESNNSSYNTNRGEINQDKQDDLAPQDSPPSGNQGSNSHLRTNSSGNEAGNDRTSAIALPPTTWKYIKPFDLDQKIVVNGREYWYCDKCVCRKTEVVGLYNTTHPTSKHRAGVRMATRGNNSGPSNNNNNNQANLSSIGNETNQRPKSEEENEKTMTHESVLPEPKEIPKIVDKDSDPVDTDPNGFSFTGAFMSSDDGAWVTAIDDEDEDAEILDEPLSPPVLTMNSEVEEPSQTSSAKLNRMHSDPFATASIQLALSTISNQMNADGFAVETLIEDTMPTHSTTVEPALATNRSVFGSVPPPNPDAQSQPVPFPSLTQVDHATKSRMAFIALANVAEPRNPNWPENVVSALPGITLYDIMGSPHLVFHDIHAPSHCGYCGRMGDWLTPCRCGRGLHENSDDEDYSEGRLEVHFDSDVDTAEFLGTDTEDTDNESNNERENEVDSLINEPNTTTTHYFQSSNHCSIPPQPQFIWWFLLSLVLSTKLFLNWSLVLIQQLLQQIWNQLSFWLMLMSVLTWDTMYLFFDPHTPQADFPPRKIRRKLSRIKYQPLLSYSKSWMILSWFMLSTSTLTTPYSAPICALQQTMSRLQELHNLIEFTPITHIHYFSARLDEFQALHLSLKLEEPIQSPNLEEPIIQSGHQEHFFQSYSHISEMRGDMLTYDYFECLEPSWIDTSFDFQDLQEPHQHILSHLHQQDYFNNSTSNNLPTNFTSQVNTALTQPTLGKVDLYPLNSMPSSFPVIIDSGASLAISPSEADFVGPIHYYSSHRSLGGMAGGIQIKGIGKVAWSFKTAQGILTIHSKCYFVPKATARLLSPQRLFSFADNINGKFSCSEKNATLEFDNVGSLQIDYDPNNHLPISVAKNLAGTQAQINLTVLDDTNQNLTPSQKLLLLWHSRFGHKGFAALQSLFRIYPFNTERFKSASRCVIPRCEVCEYAKAHRQKTKGVKQNINPDTDGSLKRDDLTPGSSISVDHFESRLKGRTLTSRGRSSETYKGGCIFVDHMSGYIHVEEQLGFSASESIRAKQTFEKFALDHGIIIHNYLGDNGIFKSKEFVKHLNEHNQKVSYCGVNAHHKNGIAERNIRTISDCARALLLHAALHWKDSPIDSSFWPFAVRYACYLFNHCPDSSGTCPADRFYGTTVPRHKILDFHCWGCPVYVLDPTLQQGRKLPKWQPRSRRGVFVGFSKVHSSDVPLILNPRTGHISPQYHVVFDDGFTTVSSHSANEELPTFWNEIELDALIHKIPSDNVNTHLDNDWLTPPELEEKQKYDLRTSQIRKTYKSSNSAKPLNVNSSSRLEPNPASTIIESITTPTEREPISIDTSPVSDFPLSSSHPQPSSILPTHRSNSTNDSTIPVRRSSRGNLGVKPEQYQPGSSLTSPSTVRRSTRSNLGVKAPQYMQEFNHHKSFLASILDTSHTEYESNLAYMADISTDLDTREYNGNDPRAYAGKHKLNDPDMPSYSDAVTGKHANEYIDAMKKEIKQLIKQKTWTPLYRRQVPSTSDGARRPILKGTWVFKLKRYPDGSPMKFKARYCVRGDLQREGIDYFETYAPVVQWSTVRLVLTLILANSWVTKQVDYTNAFAQAELKEEVYIDAPRGFERKDGKTVLKLNNSLYGLKQAPKTFYEKLRDGLLERGFKQSMLDPCLFMKKDMICLIYVDDTIITGPDEQAIENLIKSLGVTEEEQVHTFQLRDEGEVGAFLGIQIERNKNDTFHLTQLGLTNKVLATAGMENSKATVKTPAATTPLGLDSEGEPFTETWEYPVIIGMLLYLSQNSRPDIAYAVHQCARFTHVPRQSHAVAVKRILRYLNSTKDKGMTLRPNNNLTIDCFVDADFAGLWKAEDDQNPLCVKSRTGFLITFMGCPLHWMSKLQSQIALSTMEAEYIALSQAMREVIGFREILKEIYSLVLNKKEEFESLSFQAISKTFGSIPSSTVYEDNEACLKFATVPKMSPRTKHIAIPYHFFRSKVSNGEIKILPVRTDNQLADQFTKGLPQDKFLLDRKKLIGW